MLDTLLQNGQAIPVNTAIATREYKEQATLVELYDEALEEVSVIVEDERKPICHVPCSFGKDSLLCLLLCIMAYAQLIRTGRIEKERPLIVSTVNTGVESIPMVMMTRYSAPRVVSFAKKLGVNLQFSLLKPRFTDEFFIRWASAQKMIPNPTKSGDCSVILKVDTSERHLRNLSKELAEQGYTQSPICSMLGSRDDESPRRSSNIEKAQLRDNPLKSMTTVNLGRGNTIFQFAPIAHWTDEQVFLFHQLAGTNPMTQSLLGNTEPLFPTFLPNHGLTLAIYGNGKNETCSVVVGQKNNASCGGSTARYGCYVCPMTGSIDKSSEALTAYPRWTALGGDKALAIRDWLFRMSTRMHARAFHAKAVDNVGYNRIALQPNTLKAKFLEKMVWYASQLSVESEQHATAFRRLVAKGEEMQHPGMQDIASDDTLTHDVKRQFLEMYKETAQTPLYECFSKKHALMLSFRWLVDGVATTSFKPISIFQRVLDGERLPLPMTNRRYEAEYGPIKMANYLPDAVMIPFHTANFEAKFNPLTSPSFLSYWQRPHGVLDLFDSEFNCSIESKPANALKLTVTACCHIDEDGTYTPVMDKPKTQGRLLPELARTMLESHIDAYLRTYYLDKAQSASAQGMSFADIRESLSKAESVTVELPFITESSLGYQLAESHAQPQKYNERTERVIVRKAGRITRTTTRMNFYPAKAMPASLVNKLVPIKSLGLDFLEEQRYLMSTVNETEWDEETNGVLDNLVIDERTFAQWNRTDGWNKALDVHDTELANRLELVKKQGRTNAVRQIRVYGGSGHAHTLLRTAGIEVAPKYTKQLFKTLKRTDLFSEIGVYDYAALSQAQLLRLPNLISMPQHRQDKIACVQMIRAERNALRRLHKTLQGSDYTSALSSHFSQMQDAIVEVDRGLFGVLRGHVDTASPSTLQRAAAARVYLGLKSPSLLSHDLCLKHLFSKVAIADIRSNPAAVMAMLNGYVKSLESLSTQLNMIQCQWKVRVSALKSVAAQMKQDASLDHNALWVEFQEQHNVFAQHQSTYYPQWGASREVKVEVITQMIAKLEAVLSDLESMSRAAEKSIATSSANAVKSLSFKDKLQFLTAVA
ncbi:phosphoadenosine phosphosulfate reductase family protein [Vibrio mediterranei]|uniref:phosphoadenosine phosphosulfate reductase domain-containing protein n=1 Tax=Vibrio mediterranei TaxID=689 RepID=UPI0038CE7A98